MRDHPPDLRPERDTDHPVIKALAGNALVSPLSSEELARWYPGFEYGGPLAVLAVALRNRQGVVVGALMLVQDRGALQEVQEHEILTLVEALAGTAATAIESQLLYLEQKQLLEALIQLVAGAIDRKSPYTGGHCERVPELVKMIAHAAEDATTGPFKDFALSEDQWQTLHIAAWLHDCGKVTTPEYVVDKATKLETIYDRLHEVRMRFEVVKREAEVACWQAIAGGEPSAARLAELRALWGTLDEEFAFVAECNEGGEFMAPDKVERLRRIAERTWTRTLDDRIGLGPEEQRRKNGSRRRRSPSRSRCSPTSPSISSCARRATASPPTIPGASRSQSRNTSTTAAKSTIWRSAAARSATRTATKSTSISSRRSACCRACRGPGTCSKWSSLPAATTNGWTARATRGS